MSVSLDDFMEQKGCACTVCYDPYDESNKWPVKLSGCQHSLCVECFKGMQKRICPECREPFAASANPERNIVLARQVETVKELWQALHGPKVASSSTLLVVEGEPVEKKPKLADAPAEWGIQSWRDLAELKNSIQDTIINAFPAIVEGMRWQHIAHAWQEEFNINPSQWAYLADENGDVKAITWLKPDRHTQGKFSVHWTGTVACAETDLYMVMFRALVTEVMERTHHIPEISKKNVSLSYDFRYRDEWDAYQKILLAANASGRRIAVETYQERIHAKARVTIYPWGEVGPKSTDLAVDPKFKLVSFDGLSNQIFDSVTKELKEGSQIGIPFRFSAAGKSNHDAYVGLLEREFKAFPDRFFIYTVSGKAVGFVQFSSRFHLEKIYLMPEHKKFQRHFIEQFLNWVLDPRGDQKAYAVRVGLGDELHAFRDAFIEAAQSQDRSVRTQYKESRDTVMTYISNKG